MPTYDYRLPGSDRVYEVKHAITRKAHTWGELCELGGLPPGDTPPDAPVERLVTAAGVIGAQSLRNPSAAPCGRSDGACGGGSCAFN